MKLRRSHAVFVLASFAVCLGWLVPASNPRAADPHPETWKSGDVLFLNGTSWRSRIVRWIEGADNDFSHVGIVMKRGESVWIIHADPEFGQDGHGQVVAEPWRAVLSPDRASGGAVYRLTDSNTYACESACRTADEFAKAHVPFDHNFDLNTPDRLYCTELVWQSFQKAGIDLRPQSMGKYLFPSDLMSSSYLKRVERF